MSFGFRNWKEPDVGAPVAAWASIAPGACAAAPAGPEVMADCGSGSADRGGGAAAGAVPAALPAELGSRREPSQAR